MGMKFCESGRLFQESLENLEKRDVLKSVRKEIQRSVDGGLFEAYIRLGLDESDMVIPWLKHHGFTFHRGGVGIRISWFKDKEWE